MAPVEKYIEIADRFSRQLQLNAIRSDIRCKNSTAGIDSILSEAVQDDQKLFDIRNELQAASEAAVAYLKKINAVVTPVLRTTAAAWHYNDRYPTTQHSPGQPAT